MHLTKSWERCENPSAVEIRTKILLIYYTFAHRKNVPDKVSQIYFGIFLTQLTFITVQ